VLQLLIQPRARSNDFGGLHNGRLKIRLTAAPANGDANLSLVEFLADRFEVPRTAVTLVRGAAARQKTIAIDSPRTLPTDLKITGQG
jgi:uncharacterized protein (TIGR00251 family)